MWCQQPGEEHLSSSRTHVRLSFVSLCPSRWSPGTHYTTLKIFKDLKTHANNLVSAVHETLGSSSSGALGEIRVWRRLWLPVVIMLQQHTLQQLAAQSSTQPRVGWTDDDHTLHNLSNQLTANQTPGVPTTYWCRSVVGQSQLPLSVSSCCVPTSPSSFFIGCCHRMVAVVWIISSHYQIVYQINFKEPRHVWLTTTCCILYSFWCQLTMLTTSAQLRIMGKLW